MKSPVRSILVMWLSAGVIGACSDAPSSGAAVDASGVDASVDANAPCCAVAGACIHHRNDAGVCDECCHGDACGYPPEADGTCLGPNGPDATPPPTGCPAGCNEVTVVLCAKATASPCECQGDAPSGCAISGTAGSVVCCDAACPAACKAVTLECTGHTCVCETLDAGLPSNCSASGIGGPIVDGGAGYCCR